MRKRIGPAMQLLGGLLLLLTAGGSDAGTLECGAILLGTLCSLLLLCGGSRLNDRYRTVVYHAASRRRKQSRARLRLRAEGNCVPLFEHGAPRD